MLIAFVCFFSHQCGTWCSVTMSPFKKAAVKGGNSKGKEHVIDVDDLSPSSKRSSSGIYDPNKFKTFTAFQTLTLTYLSGLPQKTRTIFFLNLMMPMRIWWKNSMLMQLLKGKNSSAGFVERPSLWPLPIWQKFFTSIGRCWGIHWYMTICIRKKIYSGRLLVKTWNFHRMETQSMFPLCLRNWGCSQSSCSTIYTFYLVLGIWT